MKGPIAGVMLASMVALPGHADLPLLDGNLDVQPYASVAPAEFSADLLLQVPEQVDGWAPVPLRLRVLRSDVEWIRLLTDEAKPVELARIELGPVGRPDLVTRFHSRGEEGVVAMVGTADRVLAQRRSYRTESAFDTPEPLSAASPLEAPTLRLSAQRDVQGMTSVVVEGSIPLVEAVQHPERLRQLGPNVSDLELLNDKGQLLVRADLADAMGMQPYMLLLIEGLEAGEMLHLRWRDPTGELSEISVPVEPG